MNLKGGMNTYTLLGFYADWPATSRHFYFSTYKLKNVIFFFHLFLIYVITP